MIKTLIRLKDRNKTTILEKIIKGFTFKPKNVICGNNYKVLKCYTERSTIDGLEVNYYKLGNHLRGQFEHYDYYNEGIDKFFSTWNNSSGNFDKEKYFVNLVKKKYDEVCERLSIELSSLPNYEGTCYRFSYLKGVDTYGKNIEIGDLVMDNSYLSSSIYRGSGGMAQWGIIDPEENANGNFIIKSKSGKYIQSISGAKTENEVLFDKQTIFKITEIDNPSKTEFYIYMEELIINQNNQKVKDIYTGEIVN